MRVSAFSVKPLHAPFKGRRRTADHNHMSTAFLNWTERATFGQPVPLGVLINPVEDALLLLARDALVGVADTLEDVMDVLGNPEDARPRLWDCLRMSAMQERCLYRLR